MTRRAYLYFVLTFLLGTVVGGTAMFYYGWNSGNWRHQFDVQRVVGRMTKEYSLDDAQVQKLTQIMEDYGKKRSEIEQKNEPQFDALRQDTRNQVRQILNSDQLAKFNEHIRRVDEERQKVKKSP